MSGTKEEALAEKSALADYLRETTGLELSPEKTKVTALTDGFEFLGFRFGAYWNKCYGFGTRVEVPKAKAADLRHRVKQLTGRNTTLVSLGEKLQEINTISRGWANYYRYCAYAGDVFTSLDWYIGDRIWRWLRYKRPKASAHEILASRRPSQLRRTRKVWRDGSTEQFVLAQTRSAGTALPGWGSLTSPCLLESRMRNESRKSGSGRGGEKPVAERRRGALPPTLTSLSVARVARASRNRDR